jgi:uncharacterized metal-binding protein YceD (DUF177 family)
MTPEMHRPVAIDRFGAVGLDVTVEATAAECSALARRMTVPSISSLTCRFRVERESATTFLAHGHLLAHIEQICVVSLEEFAATVEERFSIRFVPEGEESDDDDPEAIDEITYEGGAIDLGEATAEQLGLALDPYPRAPGAELPEFEDGGEDHQFAALAALKRPH